MELFFKPYKWNYKRVTRVGYFTPFFRGVIITPFKCRLWALWHPFKCSHNWVVATQIFLEFSSLIWGRWTHFDEHIFQMGWFNHQLDNPFRWSKDQPERQKGLQQKTWDSMGIRKSFLFDGRRNGDWKMVPRLMPAEIHYKIPKKWGVFICFVLECISLGVQRPLNKCFFRKDLLILVGICNQQFQGTDLF